MAHSSTELKLTIQSISKDTFNWALSTFNLYIAKCIIYCQKCNGPSIQDCTVCIDGWIKYKGACMPAPLILSQMMIKLKPKVQNQNQNFPFHIKIDENKKDVYNLGQNKVEIEQQFGNITFTIQANCFQKEEIESAFKSCYQCQTQQQYKFTHNCKNKLNFITYKVIYSQEVESLKYLIINLQDNLCEIYQVISAYGQTFEILILKITKSNS